MLLYCEPDKAPAELPCAECFSWYAPVFWPIFNHWYIFFWGTFYSYWYIFLFLEHVFCYSIFFFLIHLFFNIFVFLVHLCFLEAHCFSWGPEASSPSKHLNGWNPVRNSFVSGEPFWHSVRDAFVSKRNCLSAVCLVHLVLTFSTLLGQGSPPCVSLFFCDAFSWLSQWFVCDGLSSFSQVACLSVYLWRFILTYVSGLLFVYLWRLILTYINCSWAPISNLSWAQEAQREMLK